MGDANAKVGKSSKSDTHGEFGLGVRNERGNELIDFCKINSLVITNTSFRHHPRQLYTWVSPDGATRNQIDYIMINKTRKPVRKMSRPTQELTAIATISYLWPCV